MSKPSKQKLAAALLSRHGMTYCSQLRIRIEQNTPSALFRWLSASMLFSSRIKADLARDAARALADQGWTTPRKMADASWAERTHVPNRAGYARYDESTSRMLGETSDLLMARYGGDLRKLREKAGGEPDKARALLKECKGIGDIGADIFFREAQAAWGELYPFADKKCLQAADRLDLGGDARALSRLVERSEFPRLVAALVRTNLARDHDQILADASAR